MILDSKHTNGMKIKRRPKAPYATAKELEDMLARVKALEEEEAEDEKEEDEVETEVEDEKKETCPPVINITIPEIQQPTAKSWKFSIIRDDRGNLKEITATPL